jgi:FkbM family methyltransferase
MKQFFKKLIKKILLPSSNLKLTVVSTLLDKPLIVADVGSTGGPEYKWHSVKKNCLFLNFDPDPRAQQGCNKNFDIKNFPIGLWSSNEIKTLHLNYSEQASSVYSISEPLLKDYLNSSCHQKVGEIDISLKRMDNVVDKDLSPHFIKIDAEGAELEILKGSETFLNSTVLGVQAEVSFVERHLGAPYFCDIDEYLRKHHFVLFDLTKERWIRKTNLYSFESRPQVIWGNVVYMLEESELFKRLEREIPSKRNEIITKYILLLLVHKVFDYAEAVRENAFKKAIIDEETSLTLTKFIKKSLPSNFCSLMHSAFCFFSLFMVMIFIWPIPKLKIKVFSLLKMRLRHLTLMFTNLARSGINNCCVTEHE